MIGVRGLFAPLCFTRIAAKVTDTKHSKVTKEVTTETGLTKHHEKGKLASKLARGIGVSKGEVSTEVASEVASETARAATG